MSRKKAKKTAMSRAEKKLNKMRACTPWVPLAEVPLERILDSTSAVDRAMVAASLAESRVYQNHLYNVIARHSEDEEGQPHMIQLAVKRIDQQAIHDWRDLQTIKNELVGPESEAVELYPAEGRLIDSSNTMYLFVLTPLEHQADSVKGVPRKLVFPRFRFGFDERFVSEKPPAGHQQRPWDPERRPTDLQTVSLASLKEKFSRIVTAGAETGRTQSEVPNETQLNEQETLSAVPEASQSASILEVPPE